MKKSAKKFALKHYIWLYFMLFTVLILVLLWIFQVFFLGNYYQTMMVDQVKQASNKIAQNYVEYGKESDEFQEMLDVFSMTTTSSIAILDKKSTIFSSKNQSNYDPLNVDDFGINLFKWKTQLLNNPKKEITNIVTVPRVDINFLVYGQLIENAKTETYLFISTLLDPINSTIEIIRTQLFYITIIIFEIAIILTLYMSKRLTRPILKITKDMQQFAKGNYNINFSGEGYAEIEKLADVLNYAEEEISKVDGLRRELISNVSHDLRTPLTIIKSYAEMIRDLSGENKEKREEHLTVIIEESDRLSRLVNELLEISKYESGNKELSLCAFETDDFIEEIMARYEIFNEKDGYSITSIKDKNSVVTADKSKILQVMFNFINNAINYTGDNKVIVIKQINTEKSVRFEVIDNGVGINKEHLPLVFDRYYRDKKVAREVTGTGLGLSIVKSILRLHNYPFGVTSTLGEGSTFWFEIPLSLPQSKKPSLNNKTHKK